MKYLLVLIVATAFGITGLKTNQARIRYNESHAAEQFHQSPPTSLRVAETYTALHAAASERQAADKAATQNGKTASRSVWAKHPYICSLACIVGLVILVQEWVAHSCSRCRKIRVLGEY